MIEGYGSSVAPMYINEVSPRHLRGTLGVAFQLGVVLFIFISQVITLRPVLGSESTWHYALGKRSNYTSTLMRTAFFSCHVGLPIVFSISQVMLLFIVPESPKYLLLKKKNPAKAETGMLLQCLMQVDHEFSSSTSMASSTF